MNYLLDTHTLIWFLNGDSKISKKAKNIIENENFKKYVSSATIWEIAIKLSLKKIKFDMSFNEFLNLIEDNNFEFIYINSKTALLVSELEFIHRDPFDRLIIAQALDQGLTIITKDYLIKKYDVVSTW